MATDNDLLAVSDNGEQGRALAPLANDPLVLLHLLIEKGADPDALGKMMDLAERHQRNCAADAFADALAGFQGECAPVIKKKPVKTRSGDLLYKFASHDDVMEVIKPLLAKYKIGVSYDTDLTNDGRLTVTCHIRVGRHVESTKLTSPIPKGINLSETQQAAGALTAMKRHTLCAALNIVCEGEDTDGAGLFDKLKDGDAEVATLNNLFGEIDKARVPFDRKKFWEWVSEIQKAEAKSLHDVLRSAVPTIEDFLRRKLNGAKAKDKKLTEGL